MKKERKNPSQGNLERREPEKGNKFEKFLDKAIKVAGVADEVMKIIRKANHPSWYEHPTLTGEVAYPLGLNFATDMGAILKEDTSFNIASSYRKSVGLVMEVPCMLSVLPTAYDLDGSGGTNPQVLSNITSLFNTLVAASGRALTFNKASFMAYIHNTATIHAAIQHAMRAFEVSFCASYVNSKKRESLMRACRIGETTSLDIGSARDKLRMIVSNFYGTYPISGDIYSRYSWLFGNIFSDGCVEKPSYYVFRPTGVRFLYSGNNGRNFTSAEVVKDSSLDYNFVGEDSSLANLLDQIQAMIDQLEVWISGLGTTLIGDLIRVLGVERSRAEQKILQSRLNQTVPAVPVVSDSYLLAQIQNMKMILPIFYADGLTMEFDCTYGTPNDNLAATPMAYVRPTLRNEDTIEFKSLLNNFINSDGYYLNTGLSRKIAKDMSFGEQASLMRLCSVVTYSSMASSPHGDSGATILASVKACGTEVPLLGIVHYWGETTSGGVNSRNMEYMFISSYVVPCYVRSATPQSFYQVIWNVNHIQTLWSTFDYGPRINFFHTDLILSGEFEVMCITYLWDFAFYAEIDEKQLTRNMPMANASLLMPDSINLKSGSSSVTLPVTK